MSKVTHAKLGSSHPFLIQIYDADTDTNINVSGAASISAKAIHTETGDIVNFVSASVNDAANGVFKLTRSANTFVNAGVYDIELKYTDSLGDIQIYPREKGALKLSIW